MAPDSTGECGPALSPTVGCPLRRDVDAHLVAPLPDGAVADAVHAAIGPLGGGGRRESVGVVGRGVHGEQGVAGAAIDLQLDHVEERGIALPAPADVYH